MKNYDKKNSKERTYKSFEQIGIGDTVRYFKEYGQIILRLDETRQVYLTNDKHYMLPINWKKTKVISLINED
tara:strand:+ start:120 stop:335 length:216 start_codon:yes stop_codon:yes gene_type:complete